jgi:hypothetical protein
MIWSVAFYANEIELVDWMICQMLVCKIFVIKNWIICKDVKAFCSIVVLPTNNKGHGKDVVVEK